MELHQSIRTQMDRLLAACVASDKTALAGLLLYRGADTAAHFTRTLDLTHPDEAKYLEGMLTRIQGWLATDNRPTYGEIVESDQPNGHWAAQQVIFGATTPDPKSRYFGFLPLNGQYFLGDIDK
jgi:hypothetical protein